MPATEKRELDLRPATLDDAEIVADLEAARDPEDPRDPQMLRFWWTGGSLNLVVMRLVAVRQGAAIAFASVGHERWERTPERFGTIRVMLRSDVWSQPDFLLLIRKGEEWLRSEGAAIAVAKIRGEFKREIHALEQIGYAEVRRHNFSELDLVAHRNELIAAADRQRRLMEARGVVLMTVSDDKDPERLTKLHEMMSAAEQDTPTTMPIPRQPFDEWMQATFDDPAVREDRFWIAREGQAIVGLSFLQFPPVRGLSWTGFTATSKEVRGRGIARALKYQTLAQAIELGHKRVRTANDGANAPMLHINEEMGYRVVTPLIELHGNLE
jgi:GNAT superfamily N-acetyltransferase